MGYINNFIYHHLHGRRMDGLEGFSRNLKKLKTWKRSLCAKKEKISRNQQPSSGRKKESLNQRTTNQQQHDVRAKKKKKKNRVEV